MQSVGCVRRISRKKTVFPGSVSGTVYMRVVPLMSQQLGPSVVFRTRVLAGKEFPIDLKYKTMQSYTYGSICLLSTVVAIHEYL